MVPAWQPQSNIAVFHPTASLIDQLSDWAGRHKGTSVRATSAHLRPFLFGARQKDATLLVDGTLRPDQAMDEMASAVECLGADRVVVYSEIGCSEIGHRRLETAAHSQSVLYLLGPMQPAEWDAYFPGLPPGAIGEVG